MNKRKLALKLQKAILKHKKIENYLKLFGKKGIFFMFFVKTFFPATFFRCKYYSVEYRLQLLFKVCFFENMICKTAFEV